MTKPLYDSPDISLIDYTNTNGRSSVPRSYAIDERTLATKVERKNDARELLNSLEGVVREADLVRMRSSGEEGTEPEVESVLTYLEKNIPGVSQYIEDLPMGATEEDKIAAITKGLEERAAAIDAYNNREATEAPFLGNEVEEARSKQEGPEVALRYKSQYEMIPGVRARENRGAVKSYKVQRNPRTKATRIKFL